MRSAGCHNIATVLTSDGTWTAACFCLMFWPALAQLSVCVISGSILFLVGLFLVWTLTICTLRSLGVLFIAHNNRNFGACSRKKQQNKQTSHACPTVAVKKSSTNNISYSTVDIRIGIQVTFHKYAISEVNNSITCTKFYNTIYKENTYQKWT
jgi:hypothetical protein